VKFIDEAIVQVQAGKGGAGARHFRREKFVPLGGPDGGNGGSGGSVIIKADPGKRTLIDFQFRPSWKAENGRPGEGGCRDGKSGDDLFIAVPPGTQVFRTESGELLADLVEPGEEFVLAAGGRGGRGNAFFKSATNQAPEHSQPGEDGQSGSFLLSLKLVADVGLIGFPNAGKSTLISRISAARPKVADYPFTTLEPHLGVVRAKGGFSFVVADIPGLIPGAHLGKGLGVKFLKHIERTRLLAHLIDPHQQDEQGRPVSVEESFEIISRELEHFSPLLAEKKQIVLLTKIDTLMPEEAPETLLAPLKKRQISCHAISSVSGQGIEELVEILAGELAAVPVQ